MIHPLIICYINTVDGYKYFVTVEPHIQYCRVLRAYDGRISQKMHAMGKVQKKRCVLPLDCIVYELFLSCSMDWSRRSGV